MENILPRREARENAFLLAFSQTFGDIPLAEALSNHAENDEEHPVDAFSRLLLNAYYDHSVGLIKAVNTFTPARSIKLATYASRCIGNEILMYLRKSSNRRQEASIDEPLNVDGDGNELLLSDILGSDANAVSQQLEQDAERAVLRSAVAALSARERQIMELRFGLTDGVERTQKEAADALGISQSYISRLEKRIIRTLKARLESE